MQDSEIVALYWQRDERAIRETQDQYGRYLGRIARNILADARDSEECVNDTYLKAWQAMPPHRPSVLRSFLGRLTRQLAIDRFRRGASQKRRGSQYALALDELAECAGPDTTAQSADLRALGRAIQVYLDTLPPAARNAFVCRYYYADAIREIAQALGMTEGAVKTQLCRTRAGLRGHLQKEGFIP